MLRDRGCVHGAATRTLADAAQASQIARSVSFLDLFRNAIHYEGSPGLWHVLLWVMVRLHVSYVGMHWLSALITLCGVFLAVPFAPFPLPLRLLLPFTYFMAYQYSTIARYRERRLRYLIPIAMLARFWMITRFDFYHAGLVWLLTLFVWWITSPKDTSDQALSNQHGAIN